MTTNDHPSFHLHDHHEDFEQEEMDSSPTNLSLISFSSIHEHKDIHDSNFMAKGHDHQQQNRFHHHYHQEHKHEEDDLISTVTTTTLMMEDDLDETMKSFLTCQCKACKEFGNHFHSFKENLSAHKEESIAPKVDLTIDLYMSGDDEEIPNCDSISNKNHLFNCVLEEDLTEEERREHTDDISSTMTENDHIIGQGRELYSSSEETIVPECTMNHQNRVTKLQSIEKNTSLIQAVAKSHSTKKQFLREMDQLTCLQAVIERYLETKYYAKAVWVLRWIQTRAQSREVKKEAMNCYSAVKMIQSLIHGWTVKRRVNDLKSSMVILQALMRGGLKRNEMSCMKRMITTVQARFRTENTLASVNMTCLILSGEHRSLVDSSETVMNVGNEQKDDHSEMMKVKSKAIHDREPQFKTNKKSQSKNHQSLVHAVNKEIMTVFPNNKECKHNPTLMYKKTTETAATPKDEPSLSSDSTPNQTRTTLSGALSLMRHDIYRRNEEFYDTQLLMLEKDDADSKLSMVETEGEMNGVYSEHENSLIEHSKLSQAVLNEQEVEQLFLRRERLKEMDQQIQELKKQERTLKERSKHKIDLLHKYNKIKDICQFLIEKLALIENRTVTSIYEEYNLENED